jgi:excinuclease ABC subunit C
MIDADGLLIYIGKAKHLRARLMSYLRAAGQDRRALRIIRSTRSIVWEYQVSEFAALLRELELIQRWRPRLNVHGQPHRRRRTYVCLGRPPAPYAFISSHPPRRLLAHFGPIAAGWRAREAVRRLNDVFGLRDCPDRQTLAFADQVELFPILRAPGCLRYEIGTCLGPCIAGCSRDAYYNEVIAARAFLAGVSSEPLDRLQRQMQAAADALEFERAAGLRDKHDALAWLRHQLDRLRQARDSHSFIFSVKGRDGKDRCYLIRLGRVEAVIDAPSDAESQNRATELIHSVYRSSRPRRVPRTVEEIDAVFLIASWFKRHPEDRARTFQPG